jgi:hypothetical protein
LAATSPTILHGPFLLHRTALPAPSLAPTRSLPPTSRRLGHSPRPVSTPCLFCTSTLPPHIVRSRSTAAGSTSSRQKRHDKVQHPQNSHLHVSATSSPLAALRPEHLHCIRRGSTVVRALLFFLLAFLAASSPLQLFADHRRCLGLRLASKFSDIALHGILTCDSLHDRLPRHKSRVIASFFKPNFLALKLIFYEPKYQQDDGQAQQIRSSTSIPHV